MPSEILKPRVLFICLGNSCRSIMAEALARHRFGEVLEAASAGIQPLGFVALETLQVLAEAGVATGGLRSKGLEEMDLHEYRLLVNLTHYSLGLTIPDACKGRLMHRPVIDPYGGGLELYRRTREELRRLIAEEIYPRLVRGL